MMYVQITAWVTNLNLLTLEQDSWGIKKVCPRSLECKTLLWVIPFLTQPEAFPKTAKNQWGQEADMKPQRRATDISPWKTTLHLNFNKPVSFVDKILTIHSDINFRYYSHPLICVQGKHLASFLSVYFGHCLFNMKLSLVSYEKQGLIPFLYLTQPSRVKSTQSCLSTDCRARDLA